MMSEEEYGKFIEKYLLTRGHGGWQKKRPVTETDRQIYADFKAKMSYKQLAQKYGISQSRIQTSILKVAQET